MTNGIRFHNPIMITELPEHLNRDRESPLSFLTRNFFSLGLYGVFQIAAKQSFLEDLKKNREWVWLSLSSDRGVDEQEDNQFYRLPQRVAERVWKVALLVMIWVENVVTFGLSAIARDRELSDELEQMVEANQNYVKKQKQKEELSARARDEAVQKAQNEARDIERRINAQLTQQRNEHRQEFFRLTETNSQLHRNLQTIEAEKNNLAAQLVAARSQQEVMIEEPIDPVCTLPVQDAENLPTFESLTSTVLENQQPEEYRRRYGSLKTAEAVFKAAFTSVWDALMTMKEQGKGIQINASEETIYSRGADVVYRLMVMELVQGAIPTKNCHQEVSLAINGQLTMEPSSPVKATYRDGIGYGSAFFSRRRDAFTPISDSQLADVTGEKGVDAVGLQRLLNQFNQQELDVLFYLMVEPVVLDDNPQLCEARAWLTSSSTDSTRIRYVRQAESLINHLVAAFKIRFSDNLQEVWAVCDEEIPAFDKSNPATALACDFFKPWAFSWDAVVGLQENEQTFGNAICERQEEYVELFAQLEAGTWKVKNAALNKVWLRVQRSDVRSLYYSRHEVIDGQGCLFSALLTLIMPDAVTNSNIILLRAAMANYLRMQMEPFNYVKQVLKDQEEGIEIPDGPLLLKKRKEAEFAFQLEQAVLATYQVGGSPCTLEQYRKWLLGNSGVTHRSGGDGAGGSEVEILLCAQLLGVSIGVIGIGDRLKADSLGMMRPTRVYGPKTKEILLLAATGINQDSKLYASYYSLFPKIPENTACAALEYWKHNNKLT